MPVLKDAGGSLTPLGQRQLNIAFHIYFLLNILMTFHLNMNIPVALEVEFDSSSNYINFLRTSHNN